jgi:hypothetical protein
MRKLDSALCVHKDFVSAVMAVDFAPTGREFVAGSYDRSVRIFKYNEGRSREVYYNRRMQRVFSVQFSGDSRWVLSGSDEGNIRLWKANASEDIGTALPREQRAKEYRDQLKARFAHMPEIRRISRHRNVPKSIHKATIAKRGTQHFLSIPTIHSQHPPQLSRRQRTSGSATSARTASPAACPSLQSARRKSCGRNRRLIAVYSAIYTHAYIHIYRYIFMYIRDMHRHCKINTFRILAAAAFTSALRPALPRFSSPFRASPPCAPCP